MTFTHFLTLDAPQDVWTARVQQKASILQPEGPLPWGRGCTTVSDLREGGLVLREVKVTGDQVPRGGDSG